MTKNNAVDITHSISFISQRAKIVYIALASFSNKNNTCFPSVPTIAEKCGLSERSVQRAIADLIAMELVSKAMRYRDDKGCSSNIYTLLEPQLSTVNSQMSAEKSPASCQADTDPGDSLSPAIEYDNSFNQSNLTLSLQTDARELEFAENDKQEEPILDEVIANCELPYIAVNYGEDFCNMFKESITRLYYSEQLRVGHVVLPGNIVRESLRHLNYHTLEIAIDKLKCNPKREVRNSSAYLTVLLYNAISEADSDWYCSRR